MQIINNQRNLIRLGTLHPRLSYSNSESKQRRESCCCDNCGKLTHLQSLHQNLPAVVQQHEKLKREQLKQKLLLKKGISTSFHLQEQIIECSHQRRKSCYCQDCGKQTKFQMRTNYHLPQRPTHQIVVKPSKMKSFVIKKSLGQAFKETSSDNQNSIHTTLTPRSHREITWKNQVKSPVLQKLDMARKGKMITQLLQNSPSQSHQLRRMKTENSPQPAIFCPSLPQLPHEYKASKFATKKPILTPVIIYKTSIHNIYQ